jgi:hypothetical protein
MCIQFFRDGADARRELVGTLGKRKRVEATRFHIDRVVAHSKPAARP